MENILGRRIRECRLRKGMSQAELADQVDGYSSRSAISKVEKGINQITQSKIIAFAEALNTTPAYLMGWTDDPYDYDLDEDSVLAGIPTAWLDAWREEGISNAEIWQRYSSMQDEPFEDNKKSPDTLIDVEGLSDSKRKLIDYVMSLSDDEVEKLLSYAEFVLSQRG